VAIINVQERMKISITSTTDAAARQRFSVYQRIGDNQDFVILDTIEGGGGAQYRAWNVATTYNIVCESWWDYKHPTKWERSREQVSTSQEGALTTIRCEDYWSTDNDWNDLVVNFKASPVSEGESVQEFSEPQVESSMSLVFDHSYASSFKKEVELLHMGEWVNVIQLKPGSAIKLEAYTSENNYIQPWSFFAWRAYSFQPAGIYIEPFPSIHEHSKAVEWSIGASGVIRVRKTTYPTGRLVKITSLQLLRGEVPDIFKPFA